MSEVTWQVGRERLLKLAAHLETGVLGHRHFRFSVFNEGPRTQDGCGTIGCALGECPIVFPDDWVFTNRTHTGMGSVRKKGIVGGLASDFAYADEFFSIDDLSITNNLFAPIDIRSDGEIQEDPIGFPWLYRDGAWSSLAVELGISATKIDVAKSIRLFVEWGDQVEGYQPV